MGICGLKEHNSNSVRKAGPALGRGGSRSAAVLPISDHGSSLEAQREHMFHLLEKDLSIFAIRDQEQSHFSNSRTLIKKTPAKYENSRHSNAMITPRSNEGSSLQGPKQFPQPLEPPSGRPKPPASAETPRAPTPADSAQERTEELR